MELAPLTATVDLNSLNSLGTMKISSRYGLFDPLRVIIAPGQKANVDNLVKSFRFSTQ